MSTEKFNQAPGKRPITFCRGQTHWLSKAEFESVKASGMFGEFYPDQPDRWEDLTEPAATPTPLASTAMEAAKTLSEILINPYGEAMYSREQTADCIARHFQPLLAKVEEKPDAKTLEGRAAIFLRETGMVAPFKDSRDGAFSREEREEAWAEWLKKYRASLESENIHGLHEVVRLRAELTALRADLAAAKEDAYKIRKDVQFIQEIAYEVCRTDDDPHGDMLTIEGIARGILGMPPDDGFEATPIRITAAQFTEMLRAYGWADNKESLQMFFHQLRADLAAKEEEIQRLNALNSELVMQARRDAARADQIASEIGNLAPYRNAIIATPNALEEAIEKMERYARRQGKTKMLGKSLGDGSQSNPNYGQHYPAVQSALDRCKSVLKLIKAANAALASRADKGGVTAAGTPDDLKAAVDALAQACGFPKSDNYVQMLETIGKRERRLTEANNTLRKQVAEFEKLFGLDTPWPVISLYKSLVIAESKFREQGRDFDGWESIQSAAAVAQQRVSDFLKE